MNTVCIYLEEDLDTTAMDELKEELQSMPHVVHVEMDVKQPHDLAVEYEENHNIPMSLISRLEDKGLHPDIYSG